MRLLKLKKSSRLISKFSVCNPLLGKKGNHLRGKREIHPKKLTITDVTDTKLEMNIADIMTIDPYKLLLILKESIKEAIIETQDITMNKGQAITNKCMMMCLIMKNLSSLMLTTQVMIQFLTLR